MSLCRSKIKGIPRWYAENFADYFPHSKNKMVKSVNTQKLITFPYLKIKKLQWIEIQPSKNWYFAIAKSVLLNFNKYEVETIIQIERKIKPMLIGF